MSLDISVDSTAPAAAPEHIHVMAAYIDARDEEETDRAEPVHV